MAVSVPQDDPSQFRHDLPYQSALRTIGAHIDEQEGAQICVLEIEHEFLVRYQSRVDRSRVLSARISLDDLSAWDQQRRRRGAGSAHVRRTQLAGEYQDILRALGYELEHACACQLNLEELDGTIVLSYYAPDSGLVLRKYRMIVTSHETERILRRARARRHLPAGWLQQSADGACDPLQLVAVTGADPAFHASPSTVLEYTIPSLTAGAAAAMLASGNQGRNVRYRARSVLDNPRASNHERFVKPLEAARLIAAVYARCLDPVRFPGAASVAATKLHVIGAFTRSLMTQKLLEAVELVADRLEDLRALDSHQPGLGTNTVRWMQHLAGEVLTADPSGLHQRARLMAALATIRGSETVSDRFAAVRHAPTATI
jgi:hypothetical protein